MPKKKPGLKMEETLWGYFAEGTEDFEEGYKKGRRSNNRLQFWMTIDVDRFDDFIKISGHKAKITGRISSPAFGKNLKIRDGHFNLFQPDDGTGLRQINYTFIFTGRDGEDYFFDGHKVIHHEKGRLDVIEDMATLFSRIYRGKKKGGELVGAGIIKYHVMDFPAMIASMTVTNPRNWLDELRVRTQYSSFVFGELRDTYLVNLSPVYYTSYENLALNGSLAHSGKSKRFFLFSGTQ